MAVRSGTDAETRIRLPTLAGLKWQRSGPHERSAPGVSLVIPRRAECQLKVRSDYDRLEKRSMAAAWPSKQSKARDVVIARLRD
jgi:hypothetical protein